MALERELEIYKLKLPELKDKEGKFALIHDSELIDVFGAYEDAIKEGYKRFDLEPFLVKRIETEEQVQLITRLVDPQCLTSL